MVFYLHDSSFVLSPVLNLLLLLFSFKSGVPLLVFILFATFLQLNCHFQYLFHQSQILILQVLLLHLYLYPQYFYFSSYYAICDATAIYPELAEATQKMQEKELELMMIEHKKKIQNKIEDCKKTTSLSQ